MEGGKSRLGGGAVAESNNWLLDLGLFLINEYCLTKSLSVSYTRGFLTRGNMLHITDYTVVNSEV